MEELIKQLQEKHGLSLDQSSSILTTISNFLKEKFPMMAGAIDNFLPGHQETPGASTTGTPNEGSLLDKISDFIPGTAGEKIEEFAKDKLGGILGK